MRTPHVSSFGAEACAAAASACPTSSPPEPSLLSHSPRTDPAGPRAARLRAARAARRARRACECGSRSRQIDRPSGRRRGRQTPFGTVEELPRLVAAGTAPHPTLRATPSASPALFLSTPSRLGSQARPLAERRRGPWPSVRAAAPHRRAAAQPRRRHDDEIRQTSSYLVDRTAETEHSPSVPPVATSSALARPAPTWRTTRPTAHPPWRRLVDPEKVHGAPAAPSSTRAPPPAAIARSPRPARGRCIPFAVTPSEGLIRLDEGPIFLGCLSGPPLLARPPTRRPPAHRRPHVHARSTADVLLRRRGSRTHRCAARPLHLPTRALAPSPQRMEVRVGIETPERAPAWSTRHLARKGVCGVRLARSHSRAMPAEPGASCAVRTHQRISHNHVSCSAAMRTVVNHAMDNPPSARARARPTSHPPLALSPPTLRGQVVRLVLC